MSRRYPRPPTKGRPGRAHYPAVDPNAPGCCRCGLPLGRPNRRHLTELPPTPPEVTALEARRLGEHLEEDDA